MLEAILPKILFSPGCLTMHLDGIWYVRPSLSIDHWQKDIAKSRRGWCEQISEERTETDLPAENASSSQPFSFFWFACTITCLHISFILESSQTTEEACSVWETMWTSLKNLKLQSSAKSEIIVMLELCHTMNNKDGKCAPCDSEHTYSSLEAASCNMPLESCDWGTGPRPGHIAVGMYQSGISISRPGCLCIWNPNTIASLNRLDPLSCT